MIEQLIDKNLSRFYFLKEFQLHSKIVKKERAEETGSSYLFPAPVHTETPPFSTSPTRAVHLLQCLNLPWQVLTIQSPQFILWFTLGVVCSVGLETLIMTFIHIYGIIQCSFTTIQILCSAYSFLLPKVLATTD